VGEPRPGASDRIFYRSILADIGYVVLLAMVVRPLWRVVNPFRICLMTCRAG
jgi:cytochrome b561